MSVILLVRHGQATFGLGTYDRLSEHGQLQASRLAEVLSERGIQVDRIISGDLERQRETAEILASGLGGGLSVGIDPGWNEYDHLPLIARVKPMYRKHWFMVADLARTRDPNRRLQEIIDEALTRWVDDDAGAAEATDALVAADMPDADTETFTQYRERIQRSLDTVAAQSGTTVVVSSAGTITAGVAPLFGLPASAWTDLHRVMVNTSVTKVVHGQRGLSLISFNEHGHLEGVPGLKITYR